MLTTDSQSDCRGPGGSGLALEDIAGEVKRGESFWDEEEEEDDLSFQSERGMDGWMDGPSLQESRAQQTRRGEGRGGEEGRREEGMGWAGDGGGEEEGRGEGR